MHRSLPKLAIAIAALTALPLLASAADEPNPLVAQIKAQLKDSTKPFTMMVHIQVKEGTGDKLETAFIKAIKESRKEKGCLTYDLNRDAKDPTRFVVYERWKSLADLEAHLKAPHIVALLAELKDVLAGAPDGKVFLPAGE
ncbi:MAG: antibiotic biosynthesis monooxygenase [Gemmataceae bacterium]|nr:antibiotic biosynthesis monooxygenase [Gemmataceae bacterium]